MLACCLACVLQDEVCCLALLTTAVLGHRMQV